MKTKILITLVAVGLLLTGFAVLAAKKPIRQVENKNDPKITFTTQINRSLKNGVVVKEINKPNLSLPIDIKDGQIKKYFKIDDIYFALVLRNSMNVVLSLPFNFTPTFTGVLVAKQGDAQWTKFLEIKDADVMNKNNPYYLVIDNKKLLLTIVDQNGTGSGEGIMKVFALSETSGWDLVSCYYFGGNYGDQATNGDYFAYSIQLSKQTIQPIKSCNNVHLISNE